MSSVYKREFKAFFHTVIGWIFIAAMLFVTGLYFTIYNMLQAYPKVEYTLQGSIFLFLIAMPILTMRVLSEERKQKTDQLILTAPVSVWAVVLGKYLAMATIFAITVAVTCVYPVVMSFFGTVAFASGYCAILAYALYGFACIAIGLFISSLTESIVISALCTFAALFVTYMMSGFCTMISSTGNILTTILGAFDMRTRCTDMMNGTFELDTVIYFVTVIFLMLFLTVQSIQKRRWENTKSNRAVGVFTGGFIAIIIAVCVIVNAAVGLLPETVTSIDVTQNSLYSLTDESKEYLANLEEDVTIYVLGSEGDDYIVDKTLKKYEGASSHISVVYKDPTTYPSFYETYTDTAPSDESMIVVCGDSSKVVDYADVYEYEIDYTTYSQSVTGYDGEGLLTSAIANVTSEKATKVYIITGQDEQEIGSDFTDTMDKRNIAYEEITLLTMDAVPDDCSCLIINSPSSDFSEADAKKITDYLENGGNAFIVCGVTTEDMPNFESILEAYSLGITGGLLVDNDSNSYVGYPYYIVAKPVSTDLTSSLSDDYLLFISGTGITEDASGDASVTQLATTSESAVVKSNPANMTTFEAESGDAQGEQILAAWSVITAEDAEASADASSDASGDSESSSEITSNVVAVSGMGFLNDEINSYVSGHNADFFSSCIAYMTDTDETTVSIAVKDYGVELLTVTNRSVVLLSLAFTVILPVFLVIFGIIVWARRRRR